jgi:hypothetical protein
LHGGGITHPLIKYKNLLLVGKIFSILVIVYILFFPRLGEIGRLPAIEDWLYRFNNGLFPYNSTHTPSSYPVIFFIAYPFYLINATGIIEFMGIAIFMFLLFKGGDSNRGILVKLAILMSSIVIYYEIVTRSELFFNMMLVALVVYLCEKYLNPDKIDIRFLLTAVLTGIILATRSVTALLFLIYFLYKIRYELKYLFLFGGIALLVFISFIIPFYIWDPVSFMTNGPFAVQSYLSNLPITLIFLIFIAGIYSGWAVSGVREFFFSGGVILFFAALGSFLFRVFETGVAEAVISDGYDIAYFIFAVPMLLLAIRDNDKLEVIQVSEPLHDFRLSK